MSKDTKQIEMYEFFKHADDKILSHPEVLKSLKKSGIKLNDHDAVATLKLMAKAAVASKSSSEFAKFIETKELPAIKLTQHEMALVQGGCDWACVWESICYAFKNPFTRTE